LVVSDDLRTELVRKSIHMLIGLVPALASLAGTSVALALLTAGTLFYTWAEYQRNHGRAVFLVSRLTAVAARTRDQDRFVLGPVTLALGAMISLLLYPEPAAAIAIYALAFGDGVSSLIGKAVGDIRLPFTGGKTLEGSLACFLAVFASSAAVTNRISESLAIAIGATVLEMLPLRDLDNMLLPVGTGFIASLVLIL
jgi:dolichol kinase